MSSGQVHLAANIGVSALALASAGALLPHLIGAQANSALTALGAGLLVGSVLVTPDLDMYGVRTVVLRAWGPLWVVWWPVLRLSSHRGRSHTYVQGPLFRAAYFLALCFLVVHLADLALGQHFTKALSAWLLAWAPWWSVGYLLTQWCHLALDRVVLSARTL